MDEEISKFLRKKILAAARHAAFEEAARLYRETVNTHADITEALSAILPELDALEAQLADTAGARDEAMR